MEKVKQAPRRFLVDALAILFGVSSWVEISGLAVELPVMVQRLPESWKLPSYVVVITQLANIGPLSYSIARRFKSHKVLEVPAIHITLGIASISCILLAFFWDRTTLIAGSMHSTALLTLAFCLAFVDCTSSVLYLPFMANFREIYVVSCMIGEGMSGLLPSIIGLLQGVGGNPQCQNVTVINSTEYGNETIYKLEPFIPDPRFSVGAYFVFLCVMIAISWIAFILLYKLPNINEERVCLSPERMNSNSYIKSVLQDDVANESNIEEQQKICLMSNKPFAVQRYIVLLAIQTYVCTVHNGILSSIQTFSCLPYGNVAYHLSVNLSMMANPVACFIAIFFPVWTLSSVIYVTIFSSLWAGYILATALLSPSPPLVDHPMGAILVVFSWIVFVGAVSYVKACIAAILRRAGGNTALFWGGAMSQVGSAIGGVTTFILVNETSLFKAYSLCPA